MRSPLVPVVVIVAMFIFIGENIWGCFSKWLDPSRDQTHYAHFIDTTPDKHRKQWLLVRLTSAPEEKPKSIRYYAEVLEIADTSGAAHQCRGKMILYLQKSGCMTDTSQPQPGDELLLSCIPQRPDPALNPHQFDYRRHLQRKGILFTTYLPSGSWRIIGHDRDGFNDYLAKVRSRIMDVIHSSLLTTTQQGIAEALFLGWKADLDPETENNFRHSGITHLLCVSGLHVGIVTIIAGALLSFLGNRRRSRIIRGLFQLLVTWCFVAISGMMPSAMRAGLMFSMIVIGQMFFTRPPTLNAIAASALILLVCHPLLLFDVGFQLSYTAVVAIVLLVRPLEELMPLPKAIPTPLHWLISKLRSLFCVSLVAQLAVSPILLFNFHQFPPYFLVANMIVVPFTGLLLATVMLMVAVSWWSWGFHATASILSAELSATEKVTGLVASWPHSLIEDIWFDGWMLLVSFAIVAALAMLLLGHRKAFPLALALAVTLSVYARINFSKHDSQLHYDIYDVGNRTAIEFFVGHDSYLICDSNTALHPEDIDFQTKGNRIWRQTKRRHIIRLDSDFCSPYLLLNDRFIAFNDMTMRIIDRSNYRQTSSFCPSVDYLLLRESPYVTVGQLRRQYLFDTLLVGSQNWPQRRNAWQQQCDSIGLIMK